MKIKYIVALMTVIATAGGCTQDTGEQPEEAVPIRLAATITPTDVGKTRAFGVWGGAATTQDTELLTGQTVRAWISENDGSHTDPIKDPIEYTVSNAAGDLEPVNTTTDPAFYYPQGVDVISIHAIHPSGYASGGTFTVNTDQTTEANYAASDLCYSMPANFARTDVDANGRKLLQMKHLLSKIVVNLTLDANVPGAALPASIKLHAKTSTTMTFPVASSTDANCYTGCTASDASNPGIITMKQEAIIPPQTIAAGASFLSFSVTGVGPMIYPMPAATTFESGKMYTYNIRVKNVGIDVTTNVTDWGTKVANQAIRAQIDHLPLPFEYISPTNLTASNSDISADKYVGTTHRMATTMSQATTAYFVGTTAMDVFKNRTLVVEPDGVSTGYYHLPTAQEWLSILPADWTSSDNNYVNGFMTVSGSNHTRIEWGVGQHLNMEEPAAWGAVWNPSTSTYSYKVNRQFKNDYNAPSGTLVGYGLRFKEMDGNNGSYTCALRYQHEVNYSSTGYGMLTIHAKYVGDDASVNISTISSPSYWNTWDYEILLPVYGQFDNYKDMPAGSETSTLGNTDKGYFWSATRRTDTYTAQYCVRFDGIDVQGNTFHTTYQRLSIPIRLFKDAE